MPNMGSAAWRQKSVSMAMPCSQTRVGTGPPPAGSSTRAWTRSPSTGEVKRSQECRTLSSR
jgi:hypothetical protein